nr:type II CAAX endopeptidase family protein [Lutimaribacter sp. EGI FJ00013]
MPRAYAPLAGFVGPAAPRSELWRLAVGVTLIIALALALGTAFGALLGLLPQAIYIAYAEAKGSGPGEVLYLLLGFSFFLVSVSVCIDLWHGRSPLTLLGRPALALRHGWRVLVALIALNVALWLLPPWDNTDLRPGLPLVTWVALLPLSLVAVFIQVTTEEVLFRGYLLQQLAARFAHPAAWMVLPSAVFGALHFDPSLGGNSIWVISSAMLFGIAACDLTARSGSLGPAIALHFVNNASAFLLVTAQDDLSGLALFRLTVDLGDPAQLRNVLLIDTGVMLCSWLAARVALRR